MMTPKGFQYSGVRCGLKNKRNDLGLIVSNRPVQAAGVFTTNQFCASCVGVSREALKGGLLQAIVVNSGNANCATGEQGLRDSNRMAQLVSDSLRLEGPVAVASTGVIGKYLDMVKVEKGIHAAAKKLTNDIKPFMEAILTTDIVEKWAIAVADGSGHKFSSMRTQVELEGNGVVLGVAKGSGMIAPNMATMLAYLVTDLDLSHLDLHSILKTATDLSFNRMTVDSDTSTNDMLMIMANGESGVKPDLEQAQAMINAVCVDLAKQVARDGEGATKLVEVRVTGTSDPVKVARTIADSPLVKTAMFGCDPNWGRILMAAGKAEVPLSTDDAVLSLFGIEGPEYLLFEKGRPTAFDPGKVSAALKSDHVVIDLKLSEGETATMYTCDFGYGYVRINAEYTT